MKPVVQFNWRRHWIKKVEPHLKHELVQTALDIGMGLVNSAWKRGDPPYRCGAVTSGRVVEGKLTWYQPRGLCHWIAFFSMAIGVMNYPDLDWRFVSGELHTVPVGFDAAGKPRVVMDILLFDRRTSEESIAFTQQSPIHWTPLAESVAQWEKVFALFTERLVPKLRAAVQSPR